MQNGAYAEIYANLERSIIINEVNNKYGIIFAIVDQKRMFKDQSYVWQGIYKSNCIPVFLWGQEVLDKFQHIPIGETVWIVGRLEKLDDLSLEDIARHIDLDSLKESDNLIISVRDKSRVQVMNKESVPISWLAISGKYGVSSKDAAI